MSKASNLLNLLNALHESDQILLEVYLECRKIIADRMREQTKRVIEQQKLTHYEAAVLREQLVAGEACQMALLHNKAESASRHRRLFALKEQGWDASHPNQVPKQIEDAILRVDRVKKANQDISRLQQMFDDPQS